eukprot:gene39859-272_t
MGRRRGGPCGHAGGSEGRGERWGGYGAAQAGKGKGAASAGRNVAGGGASQYQAGQWVEVHGLQNHPRRRAARRGIPSRRGAPASAVCRRRIGTAAVPPSHHVGALDECSQLQAWPQTAALPSSSRGGSAETDVAV